MINVIMAMTNDFIIGDRQTNDMPWGRNQKADLKRFNQLTKGHIVFMGRKTYESIPQEFRPLKDRTHYILTSNRHQMNNENKHNDDVVFLNLENFMYYLKKFEYNDEEVFIIGGFSVFQMAFKKLFLNKIYLTFIDMPIEVKEDEKEKKIWYMNIVHDDRGCKNDKMSTDSENTLDIPFLLNTLNTLEIKQDEYDFNSSIILKQKVYEEGRYVQFKRDYESDLMPWELELTHDIIDIEEHEADENNKYNYTFVTWGPRKR